MPDNGLGAQQQRQVMVYLKHHHAGQDIHLKIDGRDRGAALWRPTLGYHVLRGMAELAASERSLAQVQAELAPYAEVSITSGQLAEACRSLLAQRGDLLLYLAIEFPRADVRVGTNGSERLWTWDATTLIHHEITRDGLAASLGEPAAMEYVGTMLQIPASGSIAEIQFGL